MTRTTADHIDDVVAAESPNLVGTHSPRTLGSFRQIATCTVGKDPQLCRLDRRGEGMQIFINREADIAPVALHPPKSASLRLHQLGDSPLELAC
jgi:hypothetical protein